MNKRPEKPLPDPARIMLRKTLLQQHSITITQLAARLNCSLPFASDLINGKKRSQEKERAICQLLHMDAATLWS